MPACADPPAQFGFRRHCVLLAGAIVVIAVMARFEPFGAASLLPNAGIYGGLHAAALSGALNSPAPFARRSLFVLAAAALDIAALYAGIFGLALLSAAPLPLSVRACIALGVCSMVGAVLYGLLIRFLWLPGLRPRSIMQISTGCLVATMLTLLIANLTGLRGLWVLVVAWWCAFSGGLYITIHRGKQRLGRQRG